MYSCFFFNFSYYLGTPEGCERVLKLGADYVFNHREENYMQKIMDQTGGKGVDIICEMLANVNLGKFCYYII